MGVINVQSFLKKEATNYEATAVPVHLKGLFHEYLKRYFEWKTMRRREVIWFIIMVLAGTVSFTGFMSIISVPYWLVVSIFVLFLVVLRHYTVIKDRSTHAYINFFILHHHFLGKLEVGFCDHPYGCQCVEVFKKYVWNHYKISFHTEF